MEDKIRIIQGFPEHLRQSAAEVYFDAFAQKIGWLLGSRKKAITYIASVMNPDFSLCAVSGKNHSEKLIGLAGYKTRGGSLVGGGFSGLTENYGFLSSLWRAPLLALLDREIERDVLLMDGIAVAPAHQSRGIGTKLLGAVVKHAKTNGYQYVRLDVINTNPRAAALYKRHGFVSKGTDELGLLKHLFGFSSSTQMVLPVLHPQNH